ncbi:hypothetical protein EDD86DRAFT_213558, partial [Gorgonomyces haynaldii]
MSGCCDLQSRFQGSEEIKIQSTLLTEGYVQYEICFETWTSRRRYTEFEQLRKLMYKSFPNSIVPPIPDKHSFGDYAAKPGKAKNDPKIVHERQILLQKFLNRVSKDPVLSQFHPFHSFVKGDHWQEIVQQSGLKDLLKSEISLNVEKPSLKKPDEHFKQAEDYTIRFGQQMGYIIKIQKRIQSNYQEMISVFHQLGLHYNGWSLTETELAQQIENTGEAIDSQTKELKTLVQRLDDEFLFGLKEYQLFAQSIDKLLKQRHKRHAEFEQVSELLIQKQAYLTKLESSEYEAQRLHAALKEEGVPQREQKGLLATINSLIDNDPEQTRRNTISKTKDLILSLEENREEARQDLLTSNEEIQRNLDQFQKQKIQDLRQLFIVFSDAHKRFHAQSLDIWQSLKSLQTR